MKASFGAWTRVEDALPETQGKVIVSRSNEHPRVAVEFYSPREKSGWAGGFYSDGEPDTNVTHWMPLPDPPEAA